MKSSRSLITFLALFFVAVAIAVTAAKGMVLQAGIGVAGLLIFFLLKIGENRCISVRRALRFNAFAACVLIVVATLLVACAGTSAPFKAAAASDGTLIANELTDYVNADTTLDTGAHDIRIAQADILRQATKDQATVDLGSVTTAWNNVRDQYKAYIQADPKLTAVDKALRLRTAQKFDDLVAEETARLNSGLFHP